MPKQNAVQTLHGRSGSAERAIEARLDQVVQEREAIHPQERIGGRYDMKKKTKNCCGDCFFFNYEDVYGEGICEFKDKVTQCAFPACSDFDRRKEQDNG